MPEKSSSSLPASFPRRDVAGWLVASAAVGAAASIAALWAIWRPLPFLPAPAGSLAEHAGNWAKLAAHRALPIAFEDSAVAYGRYWSELGAASRVGIELRLGLSALVGLVPFGVFARPCLKARDQFLFVRGARRHEGKDAILRLRAQFQRLAARQPDHDLAPKVPWPSSMWTRHVLLVGGVGSGKSTALRPLVRDIVEADEQLFLFDPKGEFTAAFTKPAIVAPWDSRSYAWDLAKDLRNVQDMRRFAGSTIKESHDPMWANAARQLLVGLLVHLRQTRGAGWGWRELSDLVSLPQPALLSIMSTCHKEAIRAVERASATTTGVLINLSAFCSPIHDLAEAWGDVPPERRVSVVAWARGATEPRQLILQGHAGYGELTRCYVEGMAGVFATLVNSVEFDDDLARKIWFVADEFPQAGKLPVRALFEVGRSRGVRCVVVCQDFAQLDEVYGEKFVKALLSMCGTLIVGQVMPGETAESLCKVFGAREVERPNRSEAQGGQASSSTLSYAREEIAIYKPSELASRLGPTADGKGVRMVVFVGGNAHEIVWPIYALPVRRPRHAPADWTIDREDELLQSTLRVAYGEEDPSSASWVNEMRGLWWRERLPWLPSGLRRAFARLRRAILRAAPAELTVGWRARSNARACREE
ncbi:type IV secretion system DNA-binding domain-containing protein [Paraburkholderia tropica]|uniref:type IV secretion system DNA-binding domain-containing protein n=1 Tax=Paraburkholderia tropica TaxID=92647 RepID=UPI002AB28C85|nr:type IV secretion system DNA-binding domain-containing protein [Paraburkholderia tropica]